MSGSRDRGRAYSKSTMFGAADYDVPLDTIEKLDNS